MNLRCIKNEKVFRGCGNIHCGVVICQGDTVMNYIFL